MQRPPSRRTVLLAGCAVAADALANPFRPGRVLNAVERGADPGGNNDSAPALQAAIDELTPAGGTLYLPAGNYRIGKTLRWANPAAERRSGIHFVGDGTHATVLQSAVASGPLIQVRGAPAAGPVSTTFFWGGGLQGLTLDGSKARNGAHDAIEVLGWMYGTLEQVRIRGFSRHGIRAVTDLALNPNPDFSASTLFLKACWIERCGGWGFKDDGGVQGSPAWDWSHVVFALCGEGGAFVASSAHKFDRCSFSGGGWSSETATPPARAYGLYFAGAGTASSRHQVVGCEFDNNLTAHVSLRFATASSFINNRFIFNDRYRTGRLCPAVGVEIGAGDAKAVVRAVEFRQSFFRFDRGGTAVGFDLAHTANSDGIQIQQTLFSDNSGGKLQLARYRGHDGPAARNKRFVIDE